MPDVKHPPMTDAWTWPETKAFLARLGVGEPPEIARVTVVLAPNTEPVVHVEFRGTPSSQ